MRTRRSWRNQNRLWKELTPPVEPKTKSARLTVSEISSMWWLPKRSKNMMLKDAGAATLNLGYAKSNDAHCLACGFKMKDGANVGLCPKCGSDRWYKTRL